ncbi:MAG TPA: alpha/beta hydrolase [Verrucomicrobiae bacterium]|nr:alpha/beta hydrolase [Verrucomicrobiae bacterium]
MPELRTADGRRLVYREVGSAGPTVVCHPGGPGFSSSYLGDLGGLAQACRLVLLDPRGTGGSDRPQDPSGYAVLDYAADVEALRGHLGLERVILLGHSHGGCVAMAYAAAHPERLAALVLASTVARFDEEAIAAQAHAIAAHAADPWYEDAKAALAEEAQGDHHTDADLGAIIGRMLPLYFARFDGAARAYIETFADELPVADALRHFNSQEVPTMDLGAGLDQLRAPILVITGELDFICGPVCARAIAAAAPQADLVILPDTGHFAFAEAPRPFREAVERLVARAAPYGGAAAT